MIELLKTRRSIRKYEDREIEKEKIYLKGWAFRSIFKGRRPWEFIIYR